MSGLRSGVRAASVLAMTTMGVMRETDDLLEERVETRRRELVDEGLSPVAHAGAGSCVSRPRVYAPGHRLLMGQGYGTLRICGFRHQSGQRPCAIDKDSRTRHAMRGVRVKSLIGRLLALSSALTLLVSAPAVAFADGWTQPMVSAGGYHTAGLKADGTVVAVGNNDSGQTNVSSWTGITSIAAGSSHTVGLKADGTVVAVGSNLSGQTNVSSWTGITSLAAGGSHTVGLKADWA